MSSLMYFVSLYVVVLCCCVSTGVCKRHKNNKRNNEKNYTTTPQRTLKGTFFGYFPLGVCFVVGGSYVSLYVSFVVVDSLHLSHYICCCLCNVSYFIIWGLSSRCVVFHMSSLMSFFVVFVIICFQTTPKTTHERKIDT